MNSTKQIAIITGAAEGIGLACAQRFSKDGIQVIMADINYEKCVIEAGKINAHAIYCDIRSSESVENVVKETISRFQHIDILINNAAVAIGGNITEMKEENWNLVINTNLTSAYRFIKAVLPHMLKQQSGSVINMSSAQAHRSWDNWTAYAAAKGALLSMTTQLAGQFGPNNIRFNSISPGTINTAMLERRIETEGKELFDQSVAMHAMERLGKPEEVASVAAFLASKEAGFVTGVDIKVDGGLTVLPRFNSK